MMPITLHVLGQPQITRDGAPIVVPQAKAIALLLYLAMAREPQRREHLVDLLWPESLPQAARKNLRNTLWTLRETLGPDVLDQTYTQVALTAAVDTDSARFETGVTLLDHGALPALEAAAALYRGPLADGLVLHEAPDFELWLQTERERLAVLYLRLLERIIALHQANGAWSQVITQAQRALAVDPWRETLHLTVIEAFVRLGQRPQAMQQYAALTDVLQRELGVAPLPETTARYEALLAGASLAPVMAVAPHAVHEPETPFVGRESDLDALDEEWARAARGTARVVLISGDLGIGKTQLWRTWRATRALDAVVLTTHALETHDPLPFGPILTLFRQPGPIHTVLQPVSPLAPLWITELTRVLPELALTWPDLPPPLALPPGDQRARLLHALTEPLRVLAPSGLILVVDDLHWADPSTLDWLGYLVNHGHDLPLLVVGTYRPQDASDNLLSLIGSWQRQNRLRQRALAPLDPDVARTLLAADPHPGTPEQQREWIQQSGGNPYFLRELQRGGGDVTATDLAGMVRTRLQTTLSAISLQVLQIVAILGDAVSVSLVQAVSGRTDDETADALDQLVATRILHAQPQGYTVVHPLVATIVRADLTPARRAVVHRRAADALERSGSADAGRIASHRMEQAAAGGELRQAAQYAEQAATYALALGSAVEAAQLLDRALAWEATPRRFLRLAEAHHLVGRVADTTVAFEASFAGFAQRGDQMGMTETCLLAARSLMGFGDPARVDPWLARIPHTTGDLPPSMQVQVAVTQGALARQRAQYDAAAASLTHADGLIQAYGLTTAVPELAFERGNLAADQGQHGQAVETLRAVLPQVRETQDPVFTAMLLNNLAYNTMQTGNLLVARAYITEALVLTAHYALTFLEQYLASTLGEIALAQDDYVTAETALARAATAATRVENHAQLANVRLTQTQLALARHDAVAAHTWLAEAEQFLALIADPVIHAKFARVRADAADHPPSAPAESNEP